MKLERPISSACAARDSKFSHLLFAAALGSMQMPRWRRRRRSRCVVDRFVSKAAEKRSNNCEKAATRSSSGISMRYALGFDVGTSGARAVVIERGCKESSDNFGAGQLDTSRRVVHWCCPVDLPEHSPHAWIDALRTLSEQIPHEMRANVSRISLDATSATCVNSKTGQVLMYNDRVPQHIVSLLEKYAPSSSAVVSSTSSLAKLLYWLHQSNAENSSNTNAPLHFAHQADFLLASIIDSDPVGFTSDWHNALKLGYDPELGQYPGWLPSMLENELQLKDAPCVLPHVVMPGTVLGTVHARGAFAGLFPSDCEVVAGTTDSIAAFLASGASQLGDACSSLGSTLAIKMLSTTRVDNAAFGIYSHRFPVFEAAAASDSSSSTADEMLWLVGGASNVGCRVLRDLEFSTAELENLSSAIDLNTTSGTDYYPLPLNWEGGERFPTRDPLKGCTVDVNEPSRTRLLHGVLEGISRVESHAYRELSRLGCHPSEPVRLFSAGGGASNPVWTQMRAAMLFGDMESSKMMPRQAQPDRGSEQNRRIPLSFSKSEQACFGAALLAAAASSPVPRSTSFRSGTAVD